MFFISSYTMLLFTISFIFSNLKKIRAQLFSVGFGIAGIAAGIVCLLNPLQDGFTVFRLAAFFGFAIFCFGVAVYEQYQPSLKERWYVAAQPPAIFVLLFLFFNVISNAGTAAVWAPYLMDVFGLTFAILIILYLSSLFSWKTVGLFAVLLTAMDITLVIITPVMVTAAHFVYWSWASSAGLPAKRSLYLFYDRCSFKQRTWFRRLLLCRRFSRSNLQQIWEKNRFYQLLWQWRWLSAFGKFFLTDILNWLNPIVGQKHRRLPRYSDDYQRLGTSNRMETYFGKRKKLNTPIAIPSQTKRSPPTSRVN